MPGPGRTGELTVVLVHGAFTDPSLWSLVAAQLRDAGVPVLAPTNPLQRLASDAGQIGDVTAAITGRVLLAGHGYGGAVIGGAATQFGNTVGLVYVTGYALEAGESIADLTARFPRTPLASALRVAGPDGEIDVDPAAFRSVVAADLPAPLAAAMADAQTSDPMRRPDRPGPEPGVAAPSLLVRRRGRRPLPAPASSTLHGPSGRIPPVPDGRFARDRDVAAHRRRRHPPHRGRRPAPTVLVNPFNDRSITMKTPVIFIHGLWLHATSWNPWIELFRQAGYEPTAPGLARRRGHGGRHPGQPGEHRRPRHRRRRRALRQHHRRPRRPSRS